MPLDLTAIIMPSLSSGCQPHRHTCLQGAVWGGTACGPQEAKIWRSCSACSCQASQDTQVRAATSCRTLHSCCSSCKSKTYSIVQASTGNVASCSSASSRLELLSACRSARQEWPSDAPPRSSTQDKQSATAAKLPGEWPASCCACHDLYYLSRAVLTSKLQSGLDTP